MLDCRFYYQIINKSNQKALQFTINNQTNRMKYIFNEVDQSRRCQLWMIKQTDIEGVYTIVHAQSSLVLQKTQKGQLQLHHYKDKKNQYFYMIACNKQKYQYWISQYNYPTKYIICDQNKMVSKDIIKENLTTIWIIQRVIKNQDICNSFIISSDCSGFVLQIGDKIQQVGKPLFQGNWQGHLAQRWIIKKQKSFYTISNFKSGLLISINAKALKQNIGLVQLQQNTSFEHQLWSLQERGHRLYSIRSAYSEQLFIGTKNHELRQGAEIVLVKNEFKNLWKIIGPFLP